MHKTASGVPVLPVNLYYCQCANSRHNQLQVGRVGRDMGTKQSVYSTPDKQTGVQT